jgi:hypothetical protein
MFNSLFSFPTFLLFSPFRLVWSNTWVQWKHLTPERSIDLCLQTFSKLLLLLVPKVTTCSLYPEYIANWKLPIDAFYRESRSGVNIAKRNITTGLFGLTTTAINTFGQRKVISFFTLVTNKGEHSIFCSKETNIDTVERGEKKSNSVKGAISLNR